MANDIANQIKECAKRHNKTMQDVAQSIGISRVALSYRINRNPTYSALVEIATAIGCDIAEFFNAAPHITCPHCGKPITIQTNLDKI